MVSLGALWLPILLAGVLVFVVSNVLHMVLPYHRGDYRELPSQDAVQAALRPFNIAPGDYMLPRGTGMASMKDPAFLEKLKKGPVATITVTPGDFQLGGKLVQWFVYCLVVSLFAAYLASRALRPGADYLEVSQIASCAAFMGYGLGAIPPSIWFGKSWSTTFKFLVDALIYGFVTGGALGWLWPKM
jgi:hypothetical protein